MQRNIVHHCQVFEVAPVVRLKDLKSAYPGFKPSATQKQMIDQLLHCMPVFVAQLRPHQGRCPDTNVVFLSIPGLKGFTVSYFWSLLIQIDECWKGDPISTEKVDPGFFELPDVASVLEPEPDADVPTVKLHKPCIEDERRSGAKL